jgi:hypothetical protein
MPRSMLVVLAVVLAALVFAPAAFAQEDDNPSADDLEGDDRGGQRAFDDNPSADDLRGDDRGSEGSLHDDPSAGDLAGDDRGGEDGFDDNPTGDDVMARASESTGTDASVLPDTGGMPVLLAAAGVLLAGCGVMAVMLMRRTS